MSMPTLLINYNAKGSLIGHLSYAYNHIKCNEDASCSACSITNGKSLSLSEKPEWKDLKGKLKDGSFLEGKKVDVKQLHIEQQSSKVKKHIEAEQLRLPCVLLDEPSGAIETVFTRQELDEFDGDQTKFEGALRNKIGAH